jgi:3'-phosphoadenosine 5'-phosphosulfate sulfotransferase (PAPS reductase)/FAD synthetase
MVVAAVLRHAPDRFDRAELLRFAQGLEVGEALSRNGISVGHVVRAVTGGAGESLAERLTGLLGQRTPDRANAKVVEWDGRFGLVKVNPLAAWTSEDVWAHVRRHGVPTNPLHAQGYHSIGCAPCTSPVKPGEDPRAGRWRGREKTECGLHARRVPGAEPPRS